MKTTNRNLLALAALGLAGTLASTARAQTVINISGATLFESFFTAPASTTDYIDVDGDGFARINLSDDQLAPVFNVASPPGSSSGANSPWWAINYRETGSVAGLTELINNGSVFATDNDHGVIPGNISKAFFNRAQYINNGVGSGVYNASNPGGSPVRTNTSTLQATSSITGPDGLRIDIAPMDVPVLWGVQNSGTPAYTLTPGLSGYGMNPRTSVNVQGTGTGAGYSNKLANLGTRNLFDPANPGTANSNTLFSSPVAAVPIAVMVNFGTGLTQIKQSEVRHLFATGRMPTGENLIAVTREIGSGTRNGFANSVGLDPSWCVGENVGGLSGTTGSVLIQEHQAGPSYIPSNKNGSGDMENTMFNTRLGVGFSGAERAVSGSSTASWVTTSRAELLGVQFDLLGGSSYIRPNISALLHNDPTAGGYNISGTETLVTLGDPRHATVAKGGDAGNSNPGMLNVEAAAYVNNITRSVDAFAAAPTGDQNLFTPGEFLATKFVLVSATDKVHDMKTPLTWVANPALNTSIQTYTATALGSIYGTAVYNNGNFGSFTLDGKVPTRQAGVNYSDGNTISGNYYVSQGTGGQTTANHLDYTQAMPMRNRIVGDFNGDGKRDLNDALEMMKAYYSRHGGPAWVAPTGSGAIAGAPGTDASIELLGDFNNDGNFDMEDIRYWADGLAIDPVTGKLDRKKGFKAIDDAWQTLTGNNNFFGTVIAGGRPYQNGDSMADVAGAPGIARGWAPVGHDGVIDANDLAYIQAQFIGNPYVTDGHANWSNIAEAVGFDLSADLTGDLVVDQADVDAINAMLGNTPCYANCDGSTTAPILNVGDFTCFLQKYAAGDPYANCDQSTTPPVLNVGDFTCFLQKYAAGCP
jgi:ABC-type phosphate transport system substrate-binding protein